MKTLNVVAVGEYLFYPELGYLLQINEVYPHNNRPGQWFGYTVLKGYDGPEKALSTFEHGTRKHNGWDYNNYLLTNWVHFKILPNNFELIYAQG